MEKKTITGIMLTLLISSMFAANMVVVTAQEAHDIAVVSVTPSSTLVEEGNFVNITVVVENQGDFNETFNLNCTFNENLISTETNITLNSGASKNVTFNWNTTGFWTYTSVLHHPYDTAFPQKIAATASTVSGETDTEDNTLVSSNRVRVFVSPYVGIVPHTTVNSNLTIGTNYTVSIYTDYDGSDITGYQFELSYNPNILNGVSVTNGDIIDFGMHFFMPGTFNNTAGTLSITGAFFFTAGDVVPGPGILANVTFTVVGEGDSAITLGRETQLKGWNSTEEKTYDIVSQYLPDLFHILHGFFQNTVVTHDVAVVSVTPYPTIVIEGENVTITVVIENQGTVAEDVTVKVYYDAYMQTKTVYNLAINTSRSINFTWNTEHHWTKTYNITGLVDELLGETDTDDNTLRSDETVTVLLDAVYIRPNGSIDPPITPISTVDNVTYTLTGNISASIVVERDSIVVDGAGYSVQVGGGAGIYLYRRNNVTIKNVEVKGEPTYGIQLFMSSNNTISGNSITVAGSMHAGIAVDDFFEWNWNRIVGNNITGGFHSIYVHGSSGNTISGNNIENFFRGIDIAVSSNNSITENNITGNGNASLYGFGLSSSSNNTISGNNIKNTRCGIYLSMFSNNSIYHNNFINNTQQVYDKSWDDYFLPVPPSINIWDDGDEGNFWSDFEERYPDAEELDGSGIWDMPYVIDENNQDHYPLVKPWSSPVERKVGVKVGDWTLYQVNYTYSTNDPEPPLPRPPSEVFEIEQFRFFVQNVHETNVTFRFTTYYKDGTEETIERFIDVNTGEGIPVFIIGANLTADNIIYPDYWSEIRINETIPRMYLDVIRETNHYCRETSVHHNSYEENSSIHIYWDRATGFLTESMFETIVMDKTRNYTTYYLSSLQIIATNLWSPKPPSPEEATQELIETIEGWTLSKGLDNCLTSKLDNIIHQLNKGNENVAINKLIILTNQVEALRDRKLTIEQVDYLTTEAQRIIDLING